MYHGYSFMADFPMLLLFRPSSCGVNVQEPRLARVMRIRQYSPGLSPYCADLSSNDTVWLGPMLLVTVAVETLKKPCSLY